MGGFLRTPLSRREFLAMSGAGLAGLAAFACTPGELPRAGRPEPASPRSPATVHVGSVGAVATSIAPTLEGPTTGGGGGGGVGSVFAHSALSALDQNYNVVPLLAERLPSIDDGTWVVNSSGTMLLTWHLHRNVKWHDGHPFTARDVRFTWELGQDKSLPLQTEPIFDNVTGIDVLDDQTLVMHWKIPNTFAHFISHSDFFIYPEHIVRPLWEQGPVEEMFSHPFFQQEFVGLGPYKLDRFNPDGTVIFEAFEDFFLGPPDIARIIIHRADNTTGLVALLLAEEVHMNGRNTLEYQGGATVAEQWEAKGTGVVHFTPTGFERLILPSTNPLFGDVRVRRALLHAIDREAIVNAFYGGKAPLAYTFLHPREQGYAAAEAAVSKYPFDPREALALFHVAGWERGPDGVLTNAAGERFEIKYQALVSDEEQIRLQQAILDNWKDVGVSTVVDNVRVRGNRRERAEYTGITMTHAGTTIQSLSRRWHSSQAPSAENGYTGSNSALWRNLEADRLLERIDSTFDPRELEPILVQVAKVFSDDLPVLPLHYYLDAVAIHKNLKNAYPAPNGSGPMDQDWQAYRWEWASG